MKTWASAAVTVLAAALTMRAQQDDAPPPAIAQDGIVNAASLMPPEFGAGALAPGARIKIHGWRLGPAKENRVPRGTVAASLSGITVEIRSGAKKTRLPLESVSPNLIEAVVPPETPVGPAQLVVSHGDDASLPARVNVAAGAFGAYSVNNLGWGPGQILNGEPGPHVAANTPQDAARPGQVVTLLGTGMGSDRLAGIPILMTGIPILVGGKKATGRSSRLNDGVDQVTFTLPSDVPEGCYVPVQVRAAAGVASNVVSIAVSRKGGACNDPGNWMRQQLGQADRAGLLMLLDADVLLALDPSDKVRYRMNAAFGAFVKDLRSIGVDETAAPTPLYALPPEGTCTGYTKTVRLRNLLSAISPFQMLGGMGLNAGKTMTVSRGAEARSVGIARGHERGFAAVIGGNAPLPSVKPSPVFFGPGIYQVAGGGDEVGAFHASIPMGKPIKWTNRERLDEVDRLKGVTVEWSAARADDFVVVIAMNADNESGAMGVSACFARAGTGRFTIPPEALTDIPPTGKVGELPVNSIIVAELPGKLPESFTAAGIDRGIAYAITASSRSVQYR